MFRAAVFGLRVPAPRAGGEGPSGFLQVLATSGVSRELAPLRSTQTAREPCPLAAPPFSFSECAGSRHSEPEDHSGDGETGPGLPRGGHASNSTAKRSV